jgi:hypothetical protein
MDRRAFITMMGGGIVGAPPLVEALRVPEIGVLVFGTKRLGLNAERGVGEAGSTAKTSRW